MNIRVGNNFKDRRHRLSLCKTAGFQETGTSDWNISEVPSPNRFNLTLSLKHCSELNYIFEFTM